MMKVVSLSVYFVLFLSFSSLLLSSPSWTYGMGTNMYPSNIYIRVFPIGFPSSSDCFVSKCQEDVSITRPIDPLYGLCGVNGLLLISLEEVRMRLR